MEQTKLHIMRTVEPDSPISETEWMKQYNVGRSAKRPEDMDLARDMMRQYSISDKAEINPLYIDLINDM